MPLRTSHNLEYLTMHEGILVDISAGGRRKLPYMSGDALAITGKKTATVLSDLRCTYTFTTSRVACVVWERIFRTVFTQQEAVGFEGDGFWLRTKPAELASSYAEVKAAFEQTNSLWEDERQQLTDLVKEREEGKQRLKAAEATKEEAFKKGFDDLEL